MPNPVGRPPVERPLLPAAVANPGTRGGKKKVADGEVGVKTFMYLVTEAVQYAQCIELSPKLSVDQFIRLRNLYMIDRFYQYTDGEINEKIGYEPKTLAALREHVHYPAIGAMVDAAAETLSKPRTIDEWSTDSENRVAAELMTMALSPKNPKEKMAALTAFADRRSAKKGREDEQRPPQVVLPDNILKLMEKAAQMFPAAIQVQPAVGAVDAGRLNVPATKRLNG